MYGKLHNYILLVDGVTHLDVNILCVCGSSVVIVHVPSQSGWPPVTLVSATHDLVLVLVSGHGPLLVA